MPLGILFSNPETHQINKSISRLECKQPTQLVRIDRSFQNRERELKNKSNNRIKILGMMKKIKYQIHSGRVTNMKLLKVKKVLKNRFTMIYMKGSSKVAI